MRRCGLSIKKARVTLPVLSVSIIMSWFSPWFQRDISGPALRVLILFKQSRLWLKNLKNYFARAATIPRLPASSLMYRYLYLGRKRRNSDLGYLLHSGGRENWKKKVLYLSKPLFPEKLLHTLPKVCQVGLCSASPQCSPRGCVSFFSVLHFISLLAERPPL